MSTAEAWAIVALSIWGVVKYILPAALWFGAYPMLEKSGGESIPILIYLGAAVFVTVWSYQ